MFKVLARTGAQTVKYHLLLEPIELTHGKRGEIPGPVILVWEKSPRIFKSKPVDSEGTTCRWPPAPQTIPLQLMMTMYKKDDVFQKKTTSLKARVVTAKAEKTLGKCELDVAPYCGDVEKVSEVRIRLDHLILHARIHTRPVPVSAADDSVSMVRTRPRLARRPIFRTFLCYLSWLSNCVFYVVQLAFPSVLLCRFPT